ncbi:MAG: hypothetical protein K2P78_04635, partial [Gemmataceae bacterium]|nr:hypothetical protein [Gemmataceae bacterium]
MLSLSRQAWTNVALAAVLAAGVGFYLYRKYRKEEVPDAPPPVAAEELPVEVDAEGWRLRTDCTLVMEPTPTVRVSPAGRFIDTPGVGL